MSSPKSIGMLPLSNRRRARRSNQGNLSHRPRSPNVITNGKLPLRANPRITRYRSQPVTGAFDGK